MRADMPDRADWDLSAGRVQRDTATVSVSDSNDIVHVGKTRQKLVLDSPDGKLNRWSNALDGCSNAEDVLCAGRAVSVAEALKGIAGERRLRRRCCRCQWQFFE